MNVHARTATAGASGVLPRSSSLTERTDGDLLASLHRDGVHPLVWWAFCGFAFSIPLEYPNRTIPLEVHTITGSLFLVAALLQPRVCFSRPPAAFWWFASYLWIVYVGRGLFVDHQAEAAKLLFNYVLVALLFWIGSNLMRYERMARAALLSFVGGCLVIAAMNQLGIATRAVGPLTEMRQVVFGQDANLLGGNMALALIIVIAMYSANRGASDRPRFTTRILPLAPAILLGSSLLLSGSRGATLGLALGLVTFALQGSDVRAVARNLSITVIAVIGLVVAVSSSDVMWKRYEKSLVQGKMAGREQIYPTAWQMFTENPLFGWGPVDHQYELGWRTVGFQIGNRWTAGLAPNPQKSFHNLLLDALTAGGVVGTLPLIVAIVLCVGSAWIARAGPRGATPLGVVTVVLAVSMTIDWGASKQMWIMFAYATASRTALAASLAFRPRHMRYMGNRADAARAIG